jgi:protein tyrosine phosphatase (PTP) superfamily phosphohydrolase (DUF442 family)
MLQWGQKLADRVPAAQQEFVHQVLEQVDQMHAGNAACVKNEVRQLLWKIREPLGEATAEIRQGYEKLRNLALDNDYPRQRYTCAPPATDIPNYQMVTPNFLRGGQPDQQGLQWLAAHGADLEIDLRGSDRDNAWSPPTDYPLQVYRIAIEDFQSPTLAQVEEFIQLLDRAKANEETVFVHCKAGIGRTGLMTACWKVSQGLSADEALEAERIHSYHGSLKQEQFVRDFEAYWKSKGLVGPGLV